MPVNKPTQQVLPIMTVYASRSILYFDARWRSVVKLTQAQTQNRSRSAGSSRMMESDVIKHRRKMDEMFCVAGSKRRRPGAKGGVTKLVALSGIYPQAVDAMWSVG